MQSKIKTKPNDYNLVAVKQHSVVVASFIWQVLLHWLQPGPKYSTLCHHSFCTTGVLFTISPWTLNSTSKGSLVQNVLQS